MTKILFTALLLISITARTQTNLFPASGNVRINTTNTDANLTLTGTFLVGGGAANLDPGNLNTGFNNLANSSKMLIGWNRTAGDGETDFISNRGGGTSGGFSFYDYSNSGTTTNLMRISGNGNAGIGTLNPRAVFDVAKTVSGGQLGTVMARLTEGDNDGGGTYLGVKGYTTSGGDINNIKSFALEHSFYGLVNSSVNFLRGGGTTGGAITFNTDNNTEKMRVLANGSVAIGTQDPKGYKLAVAGSAVAESVTVKLQGNWPDYVFTKTYKLPALKEIEEYIQKNMHLPNIPSAKEIESKGQNLGEINSRLLQTVEELTLHLIQKDKQLNDQEGRLKIQEQKTKQLDKMLNAILRQQTH